MVMASSEERRLDSASPARRFCHNSSLARVHSKQLPMEDRRADHSIIRSLVRPRCASRLEAHYRCTKAMRQAIDLSPDVLDAQIVQLTEERPNIISSKSIMCAAWPPSHSPAFGLALNRPQLISEMLSRLDVLASWTTN